MKILFVEDNEGFASDLEPALRAIPGIMTVDRVVDKASALKKLKDGLIDLVILDLSIPPEPHSDAPEAEHGQSLFHEARELRPGTPIFILTGEEVEKFSRGLARFGNQVRLWGDAAEIETVSFFLKEEVDDLLSRVKTLAASFSIMNAIAINTRGKNLGLTETENQILKTFAKTADGIACDVSLLSGGLSDAKVIKAIAMDLGRKPQALCAGKLGRTSVVAAELDAYDRHVRKLGIGACPPIYCSVVEGVGRHGAIFYTLTDEDTLSFFDRLALGAHAGPAVVASVRIGLQRWTEAATANMVSIGQVRARMVSDTDADEIERKFKLTDLRRVESRSIHVSHSCIHGDLHCGNVLVKSDGGAVLIDFGDAGPGFTCLDPIALELSLVFHPDAAKLGLRDGLIDHLDTWPDIDEFAPNHELKPMIAACRDWAHDVGGGDHSVLGAAYAYAFRQLKYETVNPVITLRFINKLVERIEKS